MTNKERRAGCRQTTSGSAIGTICWLALLLATVGLLSGGPAVKAATGHATSAGAASNHNDNNNNFKPAHLAGVTSPPFVSAAAEAAAAAALGGIDVGRSLVTALLGSPVTTAAPRTQTFVKITANNPNEHTIVRQKPTTSLPKVVASLTVSTPTTTTKAPAQTTTNTPTASTSTTTTSKVPTAIAVIHKHSNKVINVSDKLHKLDLFIDPVCEQINKLTDKQLNKVYAQLKQFSQLSNNELAKCFNGHGFHVDVWANRQQARANRDNLANLCSARSLTNDPYKQFIACAASSWTKSIDAEIDRILKDRLHGSKTNFKKGQLSSADLSLIDDIVAHLHEEQVREIANELASEQQHMVTAKSNSLPSTTAPTAKVISIQSSSSSSASASSSSTSSSGNLQQSSGKLTQTTPAPRSAVVISKNLDLSKNEHSALKTVTTATSTTTTSLQIQQSNQLVSLKSTPKPTPVGVIEVQSGAKNEYNDSQHAVESRNFATLANSNNVQITLVTTKPPTPFSQNVANGINLQFGGASSGGGSSLHGQENKSQFTVAMVDKPKQAATTSSPSSILLVTDAKKPPTQVPQIMTKFVEQNKQADFDGSNDFKSVQAGTQFVQNNAPTSVHQVTFVGNPAPPTSLPPPTSTITVEQQVGTSHPSPSLVVPVRTPFGPPPPPPAAMANAQQNVSIVSPLATMLLNSLELTTRGPPVHLSYATAASSSSANFSSASSSSASSFSVDRSPAGDNFSGSASGAGVAAASGASLGLQQAPYAPSYRVASSPQPPLQPPTPQAPAALNSSHVLAPASTEVGTAEAPAPAPAPATPPPLPQSQAPPFQTPSAPTFGSAAAKAAASDVAPVQRFQADQANFATSAASMASTSDNTLSRNTFSPPPPPPPSSAAAMFTSSGPTLNFSAPIPPSGAASTVASSNTAAVLDVIHPDHQFAMTNTNLQGTGSMAESGAVGAVVQAVAKNAAGGSVVAQASSGLQVMPKIEHTVLKNVDRALDVINAQTLWTTTYRPSSKMLEMLGSAVLKQTLDNKASSTSDAIESVSRRLRDNIFVLNATTTKSSTATTPAPLSVIIIEKGDEDLKTTSEANKTKAELTKSSSTGAKHDEERKQKSESESATSVHDVIVVGEHVEGDDLAHDYEDHAEHHETSSSSHHKSESSASSSHSEHHEESESKLRIEHTEESTKKEGTDSHSDHEHLLEGLKDGDVIHVEASEHEKKGGGGGDLN